MWCNYSPMSYNGVMKCIHFPCHWPFVRAIHRSPMDSPHKSQWRGALMFSLICAWINVWANNLDMWFDVTSFPFFNIWACMGRGLVKFTTYICIYIYIFTKRKITMYRQVVHWLWASSRKFCNARIVILLSNAISYISLCSYTQFKEHLRMDPNVLHSECLFSESCIQGNHMRCILATETRTMPWLIGCR